MTKLGKAWATRAGYCLLAVTFAVAVMATQPADEPFHAVAAYPAPRMVVRVTISRPQGWLINWVDERAAASYSIDRRYKTDGTWTMVRHGIKANLRRAAVRETEDTTSLRSGNTYEEFRVRALNSRGQTLRTAVGKSRCAPVFFVAARGSGENLGGTKGDRDFAYGLGSRGHAVYQGLKRRLQVGDSTIRAVPVLPPFYDAPSLSDYGAAGQEYYANVRQGRERALDIITSIRNACPQGSAIYLFGYSQGAHLIGDTYQRLSYNTHRLVARATVFADPKYRPHDEKVDYHPIELDHVGGLNRRDAMTDAGRFASWCWYKDLVCQRSTFTALHGSFHGEIYDCFEEWESFFGSPAPSVGQFRPGRGGQ